MSSAAAERENRALEAASEALIGKLSPLNVTQTNEKPQINKTS